MPITGYGPGNYPVFESPSSPIPVFTHPTGACQVPGSILDKAHAWDWFKQLMLVQALLFSSPKDFSASASDKPWIVKFIYYLKCPSRFTESVTFKGQARMPSDPNRDPGGKNITSSYSIQSSLSNTYGLFPFSGCGGYEDMLCYSSTSHIIAETISIYQVGSASVGKNGIKGWSAGNSVPVKIRLTGLWKGLENIGYKDISFNITLKDVARSERATAWNTVVLGSWTGPAGISGISNSRISLGSGDPAFVRGTPYTSCSSWRSR